MVIRSLILQDVVEKVQLGSHFPNHMGNWGRIKHRQIPKRQGLMIRFDFCLLYVYDVYVYVNYHHSNTAVARIVSPLKKRDLNGGIVSQAECGGKKLSVFHSY